MIKNRWIILMLICLVFCQKLKAEIEEIKITWNAFKCQSSCIEQIQRNFSSIQGVNNLRINAISGIGEIAWDPASPLSYEPFRYAAAAVGINIISMRVRVKGQIEHDNESVYIVSAKDGTRFHLIGPIHIESGRYIPKYNLATHPLPLDTRDQLITAERKKLTVIISGPLFLPSYYPLTLVTEAIKVDEKSARQ